MNEQLSINFEDWEIPTPSELTGARPLTPAGPDLRSVQARNEAMARENNSANEPICYISFGSGSSGNSCYIGTRRAGVIVDAGVDPDKIADTLRINGVPMSRVQGLCLTHDHSDHVRFAYKLLRANRHIRLYCTNRAERHPAPPQHLQAHQRLPRACLQGISIQAGRLHRHRIRRAARCGGQCRVLFRFGRPPVRYGHRPG